MEIRLGLFAREEFNDELSRQKKGVNRISFVPVLIRRTDLNVIRLSQLTITLVQLPKSVSVLGPLSRKPSDIA
jgi:hypothetical protein